MIDVKILESIAANRYLNRRSIMTRGRNLIRDVRGSCKERREHAPSVDLSMRKYTSRVRRTRRNQTKDFIQNEILFQETKIEL
mmetsp:Transcript_13873/g.24873  ORF Transcript_13873/g.24873 Transcript_13873/m.24873 type:complete len:83 (-) Transcript_13873:75-323(-)